MTTQEINSTLRIVNVKGKRFKADFGYYIMSKGYALHSPKLGYLAFKDAPLTPYTPAGGQKTLQSILDAGGMTDYSTITFIKELDHESA